MSILSKLFGDPNERALKKLEPQVEAVNKLEEKFESFSDSELKSQTDKFKKRLKHGESLDDILPEAFAVVREAAKRTLGQRHYDEQIMGGIVLHQGKICEMKTGEGKTLAATMPVYLNALKGKGVHVVTVNDYLARRDTVWMGQIYHFLGLDVACIQQEQGSFVYDPEYKVRSEKSEVLDEKRDTLGSFKVVHDFLRPCERKEAYEADITYGTNNEFGFDYLRDNMVYSLDDRVQRGHAYAILDEIDSILIDEARTPLIISQPDETSSQRYQRFARLAPQLKKEEDFNIDEKRKAVTLTQAGIDKVERLLGEEDLYKKGDVTTLHHLEEALKAEYLFHKDEDYVVKEGQVVIVDEFTGRLMPGRRYSGGLHQALEAKENVEVQRESKTMATITFQNFFRKYDKLAGMTGTAATSAEEFHKVYDLDVVIIPTHEPMIREDLPDRIYQTQAGKKKALVREIQKRHKKGQPLLVGTRSIEKNEEIGQLLDKAGIPHNLLNAKNHEKEAEIIAQAGKVGAVTVATNMAGRGVDIVLGGNPPDKSEQEKVKKLGGLHVMGTERHEARRIDNQLRGRAGRQGDPGSSQFFVSLEDDLMRIFGSDRVKNMMGKFGIPEDQPIENKMVSNAIEKAQAKIEGLNFDLRKHVLEYDDVMNKQREAVYGRREEIIATNKRKQAFLDIVSAELADIVDFHTPERERKWDLEKIVHDVQGLLAISEDIKDELTQIINKNQTLKVKRKKIKHLLVKKAQDKLAQKEKDLGEEKLSQLIKLIWLRNIDVLWVEHLSAMDHLRDSVRLRAYGQRDPLVEYKNESHRMFKEFLSQVRQETIAGVFKAELAPEVKTELPEDIRLKKQKISFAQAEPKSEAQKVAEKVSSGQIKAEPVADRREFKDVGRNDPCPCGSGKKFKKCCWKKYR